MEQLGWSQGGAEGREAGNDFSLALRFDFIGRKENVKEIAADVLRKERRRLLLQSLHNIGSRSLLVVVYAGLHAWIIKVYIISVFL